MKRCNECKKEIIGKKAYKLGDLETGIEFYVCWECMDRWYIKTHEETQKNNIKT